MANTINFKVCCRCFTFNQSKYITDAMNGFCMQETDFPFVCCIVDDASTDGEKDVICKYVDEHFNVSDTSVAYKKETDYAHIIFAQHNENKNCYFAVLLLKENHYSNKALKGKKMSYLSEWRETCDYEALCEGDDYWIASDKLYKQVEYLDTHPDCGLVYAKARVYNQSNKSFRRNSIGGDVSKIEQLILNNDICTLTTCSRLAYLMEYFNDQEVQREKKNWKLGDYPMWLWIVCNHSAQFMNMDVAVYRELQESASHSSDISKKEAFAKSIYAIRMYYVKRFKISKSVVPEIENQFTSSMASNYLSSNMYFKGFSYLLKLPLRLKYAVVADYAKHEISALRSKLK